MVQQKHRKAQSFGVPPWLLTTGSLGLPSYRHQKKLKKFNDFCRQLKNVKLHFVDFDFEVTVSICSLVYFMISSFV